MKKIGVAAICLSLLAACSGVRVTDYSAYSPALNIEQFFDGRLTAQGVVKNRRGLVTRTFSADIDASWQDGTGTLVEDFVFNDGERQRRTWTLTRLGDDRYIGRAGDVSGDGTLQQSGNSVFLDYILQVPWRGRTLDIHVDDRMYLVTQDTLLNESVLTKFGIRVGELLLVIRRLPEG